MTVEVAIFLFGQAIVLLGGIFGTYVKMTERMTRLETKVEVLIGDHNYFKGKMDDIGNHLSHLEGVVEGHEHLRYNKKEVANT